MRVRVEGYVSTVGLNEETIRKYIREQEKHDIALDKLSVKEYEIRTYSPERTTRLTGESDFFATGFRNIRANVKICIDNI